MGFSQEQKYLTRAFIGKTKEEIKNDLLLKFDSDYICEGRFDDTNEDYIGICLSDAGTISPCYYFAEEKCTEFSFEQPNSSLSRIIAHLNNNKSLVKKGDVWYNNTSKYKWTIEESNFQKVKITCKSTSKP